MKAYLNFQKLSLLLFICIVLNSCAKDTDLLSEYIINGSERVENLSTSDRNTISTTELDTETGFEVIPQVD